MLGTIMFCHALGCIDIIKVLTEIDVCLILMLLVFLLIEVAASSMEVMRVGLLRVDQLLGCRSSGRRV